jgi:uncharacterized protein with PIN domain
MAGRLGATIPVMNPNQYRCAMCEGVFGKGQSDEEALAETTRTFGQIKPEELAVICDGCYHKINPEDHPHRVEESVADTIRARLATPPSSDTP